MIEQILMQNGLNEKEAKVYLSILESGDITVSHIAQKSHLKRTTVYDILETLKERGIVSVVKRRGIHMVSALPPQNLIDRFKRSATMAESILPQLMEMAYSSPLKPRMRFYEDVSGLQEILREMSYSKQQTVGFTDYAQMPEAMFTFIRKEVVPRRRENQNFIRLIAPRNERNLAVHKEDEIHYGEHRVIDFPAHINHIEILLFDFTKTAFLSFNKDELFGIILDSKAIHMTLRNIFDLMWLQTDNKKT